MELSSSARSKRQCKGSLWTRQGMNDSIFFLQETEPFLNGSTMMTKRLCNLIKPSDIYHLGHWRSGERERKKGEREKKEKRLTSRSPTGKLFNLADVICDRAGNFA